MLVSSVILAIIIGYLRKGRLSNFENIKFKLWYLISVAFLIQFIGINLQIFNDMTYYVLHILSYVIIIFVTCINHHLFSVWFLGIGNLMNFVVIAFNEGKMPVKITTKIMEITGENPYFDRGHMMMNELTRFKIFGDLFVLDVPVIPVSVFSGGDVLLVIGAFLLIQQGMTAEKHGN